LIIYPWKIHSKPFLLPDVYLRTRLIPEIENEILEAKKYNADDVESENLYSNSTFQQKILQQDRNCRKIIDILELAFRDVNLKNRVSQTEEEFIMDDEDQMDEEMDEEEEEDEEDDDIKNEDDKIEDNVNEDNDEEETNLKDYSGTDQMDVDKDQ